MRLSDCVVSQRQISTYKVMRLTVIFSDITRLVGQQEVHLVHNTSCSNNSQLQ